jgi:hypothetical protein
MDLNLKGKVEIKLVIGLSLWIMSNIILEAVQEMDHLEIYYRDFL